jgi:hypothetical protein
MKYIVKTDNHGSASAFFGFLFHDAIIERIDGNETTETYEVTSDHRLDEAFDNSDGVIEYSTAEE